MNTRSTFAAAKEALLTEQKPKLTDMSLPLEERWKIFEQLVSDNVLETNSYHDGHIDDLERTDGSDITLYDDFYMERGETKDYVTMYEKITEDEGTYTPESIAAWREAVLGAGYGDFEHDW